MEYDSIIESILFASGDPFPIERLMALLDLSREDVLAAARRIGDAYRFENRGIRLLILEDSLQLGSAPENADWVRRALDTRKPARLSPAALEVLAIAAYFQPVTRTYIEQIRGVDSSYTVGLLVDKGFRASASCRTRRSRWGWGSSRTAAARTCPTLFWTTGWRT